MADGTKIEWTDATWNPITGCSIVSPGCTNCYAMKLAGTRLQNHPSRKGLTKPSKSGPVWNGEVRFNREWLDQPLRWKKPRMIFVCAHGDLFAEGVPNEWIDQVFAVMALAPQHVFQVLTKRPERMREYLTEMQRCFDADKPAFSRRWGTAATEVSQSPCASGAIEDREYPLPNVWLGVSVEDQRRAEERISLLLDTPAAIRWISAEPLLGSVIWKRWMPSGRKARSPKGYDFIAPHFYMTRCEHCQWVGSSEFCGSDSWGDDSDVYCPSCNRSISGDDLPKLDWVVAGGESGEGARPMHPDWARSLRDQCAAAGVPFLFKQWGNWIIASKENGHTDSAMASNDAIWLDTDGRQAKPSCNGMVNPIGMFRVPKSRAGRLLDGAEHNGFPPLPAGFGSAA